VSFAFNNFLLFGETDYDINYVYINISEDDSNEEVVIEDLELDDEIPEAEGVDQLLGNFLTVLNVEAQINASVRVLEEDTDYLGI